MPLLLIPAAPWQPAQVLDLALPATGSPARAPTESVAAMNKMTIFLMVFLR